MMKYWNEKSVEGEENVAGGECRLLSCLNRPISACPIPAGWVCSLKRTVMDLKLYWRHLNSFTTCTELLDCHS